MNPLFKVNLINNDSRFALKLVLFTFNIQIFFLWCFGFFKNKNKYQNIKVHDKFSLMLNFSFKNLCPIIFLLAMKKTFLLLRNMIRILIFYAFEMSFSFTSNGNMVQTLNHELHFLLYTSTFLEKNVWNLLEKYFSKYFLKTTFSTLLYEGLY
jgi:hypothetical protein